MTDRKASRRRRRGRAPRTEKRMHAAVQHVQPLLSKLPFVEVLSEEGVQRIHEASMRLLKDIGVLIIDFPQGLETFKANGAKVEGDLVRIDEDTLMHFIRQTPSIFTQLARNPIKSVPIGGRHTVFAPAYGSPFIVNRDVGRRQSTMEDFRNFAKLTHMAPDLHHGGGVLAEPNDIDTRERHLDMLMAHITLHDKPFLGSVTHADNARDSVTMAEILFGAEAIRENPALMAIINASSPLRYDDRMFGAVEVYAKARQPVVITPFIIAGAMSPTTVAATVAQLNAETLFGICYAQMLNPGTPCLYGSFLTTIDMRSGTPCFGTPENNLALHASGQLARYYSLPLRSGGNFTASRIPDSQAGYEAATTMLPTVQSGANYVLHAAGFLEGGLIMGYEKFILDLETLGMLARYVKGIDLSDEHFAWDAYEEVGPGNHFLGSQHTLRHYDTAFYLHKVFNMDNYEKWEEEGSEDSYQKANKVWKQMLRDYTPPPLDEGINEQLEHFVAQRRAEIRAGKPRREWSRRPRG